MHTLLFIAGSVVAFIGGVGCGFLYGTRSDNAR